jgi:hypothetical protein
MSCGISFQLLTTRLLKKPVLMFSRSLAALVSLSPVNFSIQWSGSKSPCPCPCVGNSLAGGWLHVCPLSLSPHRPPEDSLCWRSPWGHQRTGEWTVSLYDPETWRHHRYLMNRLSLQVFYLWRHVSSTAPPFILWWSNLEILFGPLHSSSPFIGELRCQAIQMEHGPYIAERTQNAVYIVRCLWTLSVTGRHSFNCRIKGSLTAFEMVPVVLCCTDPRKRILKTQIQQKYYAAHHSSLGVFVTSSNNS